jgi:hypothetical protein
MTRSVKQEEVTLSCSARLATHSDPQFGKVSIFSSLLKSDLVKYLSRAHLRERFVFFLEYEFRSPPPVLSELVIAFIVCVYIITQPPRKDQEANSQGDAKAVQDVAQATSDGIFRRSVVVIFHQHMLACTMMVLVMRGNERVWNHCHCDAV